MSEIEKIISVFTEFLSVIEFIIGVYLDSTYGFDLQLRQLEQNQDASLRLLNMNDGADHLDKRSLYYGEGDPNKENLKIFHKTTQAEYKMRNAKNGKNYKFIGNMCLITIYQYWEDQYRQKIAILYNKQKSEINSDIFGDIRIIRNSIIHNNSVALENINKCKILKWFKAGDEIFIDSNKLFEIFDGIKAFQFGVKT